MRAFIITVDGLVAVSIFFLALIIIASQTFQPYTFRGETLKQTTLDALTVIHNTEGMNLAIEENESNQIRNIIEATPLYTCMQLSITDRNGVDVATISKANCGEAGKELQVAAMPFVYNSAVYMAKARAWYRTD